MTVILTLYFGAKHKCVAGIALQTRTRRIMIEYITFGILTAGARTRVPTLLTYASPVTRALGIQYAFWSTFSIRITAVFWVASTSTIVTKCIRTTRVRVA